MTYSVNDEGSYSGDYEIETQFRRFGSQIIGIVLLIISLSLFVIMWSYTPQDANRFAATGADPQNAFGGFGAMISGTLFVSIGLTGWLLPWLSGAWGLRLIAVPWQQNRFGRLFMVPFLIIVVSVFLAAHPPFALWPHGFGLGGLGGDAILGLLFDYRPIELRAWLVVLTLVLFSLAFFLTLFCSGVVWQDYLWYFRTVAVFYRWLPNLWQVKKRPPAKTLQEKIQPQAAETSAEEDAAHTPSEDKTESAEQKPSSIFERMRNIQGREAERADPSLSTDEMPFDPDQEAQDQRIREGVAAALRSRGAARNKREERQRGLVASKEAPISDTKIEVTPPENHDAAARGGARNMLRFGLFSRQQKRSDPASQLEPGNFDPTQAEEALETATIPPEEQNPEGLAARNDDLSLRYADQKSIAPEKGADASDQTPNAPASSNPEQSALVDHAQPKQSRPSRRAMKEAQPALFDEGTEEYEFPPLSLLSNPVRVDRGQLSDEALTENARMLETVLDDYGVKGRIVSIRPGPVVTMYELDPAPGLKASRVIGLSDDIARSMSALSARVSTIPGRSVIGIELPNETRETVFLREILSGRDYGDGKSLLPLALGKDIGGNAVVTDLAKMPHLLIAGTTGSGKSVAINTMIMSLLYRLRPEDCRMIMIDPKMLELSVYDGIPHLLSPVVTDPKKAVVALKWVVGEMEERYRKMSKMGVRNISGYNSRVQDALDKGEDFTRTVQTGFNNETGDPVFETQNFKPEKIPFIVVIVDEMADLMMVAGKEIEACIQRLAQMARASGIHIIMATQRPSVDVITGTIKANFPTRISFQVTSKVDSRTILGEMGAEQLLGMGDMLYMAGGGKITRVHAPFASDDEVEEIVTHLKAFGPPEYIAGVIDGPDTESEANIDEVLGLGGNTGKEDALYDEAVQIVARDRKASTSYIQRKLAIGYNKAARLVEQMEENGVVSPANHVGKREIYLPEV